MPYTPLPTNTGMPAKINPLRPGEEKACG